MSSIRRLGGGSLARLPSDESRHRAQRLVHTAASQRRWYCRQNSTCRWGRRSNLGFVVRNSCQSTSESVLSAASCNDSLVVFAASEKNLICRGGIKIYLSTYECLCEFGPKIIFVNLVLLCSHHTEFGSVVTVGRRCPIFGCSVLRHFEVFACRQYSPQRSSTTSAKSKEGMEEATAAAAAAADDKSL